MLINHDPGVGVVYFYFTEIADAQVARTESFGAKGGGWVNLDYDADGVILGVEVIQ